MTALMHTRLGDVPPAGAIQRGASSATRLNGGAGDVCLMGSLAERNSLVATNLPIDPSDDRVSRGRDARVMGRWSWERGASIATEQRKRQQSNENIGAGVGMGGRTL